MRTLSARDSNDCRRTTETCSSIHQEDSHLGSVSQPVVLLLFLPPAIITTPLISSSSNTHPLRKAIIDLVSETICQKQSKKYV